MYLQFVGVGQLFLGEKVAKNSTKMSNNPYPDMQTAKQKWTMLGTFPLFELLLCWITALMWKSTLHDSSVTIKQTKAPDGFPATVFHVS